MVDNKKIAMTPAVELPPLYTLIVAMIGGKLFGILGILFFIPLASVVFELLKDGAKEGEIRKTPGF